MPTARPIRSRSRVAQRGRSAARAGARAARTRLHDAANRWFAPRSPRIETGTLIAPVPRGARRVAEPRFHTAAAVRSSMSHDGLVLLDVRGGVVFAANAIGARIWQLLEQNRTLSDIARQLAEEHAIPIERAHADASAFVASLAERQLIVREDSE